MRFSKLFSKTLRDVPADAELISHQLLIKAGMIQQLASGVYSFLPLAWRSLRKIEQIIREEMDAAGGQEIRMPVLQPIEIWQESGRDAAFGKGLFTLNDRRERTLALGPTHEEVVTDLARRIISSYRDLPAMPYQIQTKFRDEPRPRGGLVRVREFAMKDCYSFDADQDDLELSYQKMKQAYLNIYRRCGLQAIMVEADSGAIGGKDSHEFMIVADSGEDEIVYCSDCEYAANSEKATCKKSKSNDEEQLKSLEEVSTPGARTIEEVATFLGIEPNRTLKAVFYSADGEIVFVVIRGDLEVNEVKLKNTLKCIDLSLASDQEVQKAGLVAGAASPIGLSGIKVVADDSVSLGSNFVVGANKDQTHYQYANYPRDFDADVIADIALVKAGYQCPSCGSTLRSTRGVEVGHIFKLGTAFSEKQGAYYLDRKGNQQPLIMGCYGIGVDRLLAATIEQNHDEKGIVWPIPIAPYHVYLCALGMDDPDVASESEKIYNEMNEHGIEVLFDDRIESVGVKFNDADLIGVPIRVVVSKRTLKTNAAEVKLRREKDAQIIALQELYKKVESMVK